MSLRAAYEISDLIPGTDLQGTDNADRPFAAYVAMRASMMRGNPVRGALTGFSNSELAPLFAKIERASGVPTNRVDLWINAVNGARMSARPVPSAAGLLLSGYQSDAISKMTAAGGVMALRMGLGKTLCATCAALTAHRDGMADGSRCWIVCPINAFGAWDKFLPDLRRHFDDVQVMSVDSAHKLVGAADLGGVLILDEVHTLGDMKARRTIATHALRLKFDVCFALTGTLLHAGIEKCLSMLDLAVPGAAGFSNQYACGTRFKCLAKKKLGSRTVTGVGKPVGEDREAFLQYLSRFVVSLDKNHPDVRDTADIPEQAVTSHRVGEPWAPLEDDGAALVHEMYETDGEMPHAAGVMHRLMRDGLPEKWDALMALVEKHGDTEPWVIFAHYRESLDFADAKLREMGVAFVRVDGDTTPTERREAQRKFQAGEVQVFLGQLTAAGVAIDLFASRFSVTLDVSWKAIDYDQALARTCRRGQERACFHWDLVANDLQQACINRLRDAADFNAECAEYQRIKALIPSSTPSPTRSTAP
jgi:SNF2 family DNA or RNA helicase